MSKEISSVQAGQENGHRQNYISKSFRTICILQFVRKQFWKLFRRFYYASIQNTFCKRKIKVTFRSFLNFQMYYE